MARAHAALAAEWARPGHEAQGLGDGFTFDEVRGCMRSLKTTKQRGVMGSWRNFSSSRVAREYQC